MNRTTAIGNRVGMLFQSLLPHKAMWVCAIMCLDLVNGAGRAGSPDGATLQGRAVRDGGASRNGWDREDAVLPSGLQNQLSS
jgi:hypothetical protein